MQRWFALQMRRAQTALPARQALLLVQEEVTAARIPRWRGFNLQGRFAMPGHPYSGHAFDEFDSRTLEAGIHREMQTPDGEKGTDTRGRVGCFNKTPHAVTLAWMSDCLSLWREPGWGFTLSNLRGSFGVLDSQRADVQYEDYKGHKLDVRMLELLRNKRECSPRSAPRTHKRAIQTYSLNAQR